MEIRLPRGTTDILPEKTGQWRALERHAHELCRRYRYEEIRTPIFERTELFKRGVGDTTDIVEKEMYTFIDRGERSMTLRPEGTAPVVRSFVEHKLHGNAELTKLYYIGPMFRYERPQSGRMRQFTQFGVEVIGSAEPAVDAEAIAMAMRFYTELGVNALRLELNSVGCPVCRSRYREKLMAYLETVKEGLCEDCQSRMRRNPMRVLDCKEERCKQLTGRAPTMLDDLCEDCAGHFEALKGLLTNMGIAYTVNPRLVRGLDYYTQTAFEIISEGIGAVGTLCGGGRYNGLIRSLGGPELPGIGFALSIERALLALEAAGRTLTGDSALDFYLITMGQAAEVRGMALLEQLRGSGMAGDKDYLGRKMKAQLKSANRLGAKFVLILGDDELAKGVVVAKNMATGEQEEVAQQALTAYLKEKLS